MVHGHLLAAAGQPVPAIVTGKPEVLGGTAGRRTATGLGVVFCLEAVLDHLGWDLSGLRVAVQGFGKVGSVVARELPSARRADRRGLRRRPGRRRPATASTSTR